MTDKKYPLSVYPIEVIAKAIRYQNGGNNNITLSKIEDDTATVSFNSELSDLENKFHKELYFQKLRFEVSLRTLALRELIVGRALYSVCKAYHDE